MSPSAAVDFDAPSTNVLSPAKLAHVVLRTANLERMVNFYTTFLGGIVTYGNDVISFITYDDEHHRVAIIGIPSTEPKVPTSCGLEHIAFTFNSLSDLLASYRHRKARNIDPVWCVNHGPTTSIYYKDPDGNMLETQVDNFDTIEGANSFMMSKEFAENPIGTDFDAEEMIQAIKSGEEDHVLKKRREIGPRGLSDVSSMN
ncbi:Glyoxalase/Bleomycin resistance protein/Dihydroxybiphenyl dioxygenase [Penicillium frequentans]|uniref:Glyoxalase/Bleomycin resistance protein/Dihydroxybiphenyl dioxygenase n=1 Tax=Penicillium frequentans TaxID=3151616 RepID=A0AAD6CRG0_9EURO|nr:Glyoxalase/Bleomycin resistance protein/Dihydroxybiphenyl dioxygenase [Penicillium glabrum]